MTCVSLGRGAMMAESALLGIESLGPFTQANFIKEMTSRGGAVGSPSYPSAVAIDTASAVAAREATAALLSKDIDRDPGGMYTLGPQQGAQVINLQQMGWLPQTIALGVALAAVLALALTMTASVRQRRRDLALLKSLGMRRSGLRAIVASQTSTILVLAIVVGVPLGIAAGRWAWTAFANEIGVVPAPVAPRLFSPLRRAADPAGRQPAGRLAGRGRGPDVGGPQPPVRVTRAALARASVVGLPVAISPAKSGGGHPCRGWRRQRTS